MIKAHVSNRVSKFIFAIALASPLAFVGCNYSVTKDAGGGTPISKLSPENVPTFAEVNQRIFTAYNCTQCHGQRIFNPSNYQETVAHLSEIRAAVQKGARKPMPPPPNGLMAQADIDFLIGWIDNGAPFDKPVAGATPTPTPVPTATPSGPLPSFAQLNTLFLSAKCFTCHDGLSTDDMQSYADFKKYAKDIKFRIQLPPSEKEHMPKVGKPGDENPQLTAGEIGLLVAWIDGGAPENGSGDFQMPAPAPTAAPEPGATPEPAATPVSTPSPTPAPEATPEPVGEGKPTPAPSPAGDLLPTFASINANIFETKCMPCHRPEKKGGKKFPLSDLAGLIAHDANAITKRDPVHSKLIISVTRTDADRMPKAPRDPLTQKEVDTLKRWIGLGCPQ